MSEAYTLRIIVDLDVPCVTHSLDVHDIKDAVERACNHNIDLMSEGVTVSACEFDKVQPIPF